MIANIWTYISSIPSSIWMNVSAILSGTADLFWFHAVLITGSVIAGITVGAGIIFEGRNYSERTHHIATWLVIVGVTVESFCTVVLFVGDEALSGTQQEKIIGLESRLAARYLSVSQISDIVEKLKWFGGQEFEIVTYVTNPESLSLATQIYNALMAAGWKFDKPATAQWLIGVQTGVLIWFDKKADPSAERASDELVSALTANDIAAAFEPVLGEIGDKNPPIAKISIHIGIKP
jgi:hypothetical protein